MKNIGIMEMKNICFNANVNISIKKGEKEQEKFLVNQ
jgi:hypothetical protein